MQPTYVRIDSRDTAVTTISVLAFIAAGCVIIGWFAPYFSGFGSSSSLSDGDGNSDVAVLGPAIAAVIGGLIGLRGQRRAAAFAAGAAAAVGAYCLVFVAMVYEIVSGSEGFFDASYGLGFFVHLIGGLTGLAALVKAILFVRGPDTRDDAGVQPGLAFLGAAAATASAAGLLLPNDGVSIFDVESTPIEIAYVGFAAVVALGAIAGFMSHRASGAAIGVGCALTPLGLWLADASDNDDLGNGGILTGLTDGNVALVAGGATVAVIVGVIAMVRTTSAPEPFAAPVAPDPTSTARPEPAPTEHFETFGWTADTYAGASAKASPVAAADPVTAAGWHPDPYGRHALRYWDGSAWTEHVANGTETGIDDVS